MRGFATRQNRPSCLRGGVGQTVRVTEVYDPLIVHQQEIENRPMELGILSASANVVRTGPGCIKELADQLFIGRKPSKCSEREQLRRFLLFFHRLSRVFCRSLPGNSGL